MSTNKTSLGLNLWEATDPIKRLEFNRDNEIINEQLTSINSQLLNQASMMGHLDDFDTYHDSGIYWFDGSTANRPEPYMDGIVVVINQDGYLDGTIVFQSILSGANDSLSVNSMAVRYWYPGQGWRYWKHFATAEPPKEYELEVVPSLKKVAQTNYAKDSTGKVTIHLGVQATDNQNSITGGTIIAQLPVGYRPKIWLVSAGVAHTTAPFIAFPAFIKISSGGDVYIDMFSNATVVYGEITFYAY